MFSIWIFSDPFVKNEGFTEKAKVTLRNIGHQLLLASHDSTSLVLPIIELEKSKYELSFQNPLSFEPGMLVSIVQKSFEKSELSKYYRVEVIQCANKEVSYSYEMRDTKEKSIIPCRGRVLPKSCYTIEVKFTDRVALMNSQSFLYLFAFIAFFIAQIVFYKREQTKIAANNSSNEKFAAIGIFHFYPEQNKLVKEAVEISLSKKECELLAIFIASPNQIIKRDELMKRVWEDHGVIVGRSLDTYISKLRKKLKDDDSIKITNVHGVGYKLEIN